MGSKSQLSVLWTSNILYFAETINANLSNLFSIDISRFSQYDDQVIREISKTFSDKKIHASSINISVPEKDIIFRTFIIPWMNDSEVKSVVEFEASKYVPFPLDELSYSFHSITISDNNIKNIRIIFIALRKSAIDYYRKIFNKVGVSINIIEPSTVSLIRALSFKKEINQNKTIAVVEKDEISGNIIVINNGIPLFVRSFQLIISTMNPETIDQEATKIRLANEIKVSLDYFHRQHSSIDIEKLLIISEYEEFDLSTYISQTFKKETKYIKSSVIIKSKEKNIDRDASFLKAFGSTICDQVYMPANLILAGKIKLSIFKSQELIKKTVKSHISIPIVASICIVFSFVVISMSKKAVNTALNKINQLEKQLGSYKNQNTEQLKKEIEVTSLKLKNFKTIRTNSHVAFLLATIASSLPESSWINEITFDYETKTKDEATNENPEQLIKFIPKISLTGYVYHENSEKQFSLVNETLKNFRTNKDLASIFKKIELSTMRSEKIDTDDVTFYSIIFEKN